MATLSITIAPSERDVHDALPSDLEQPDGSLVKRLAEVLYELEDIIEVAEIMEDEEGPDFGRDGSNGVRAILHKAQEARGPLASALVAARQAEL